MEAQKLDLGQVHYYERVKGTTRSQLAKINPVVRIKGEKQSPPLFIQHGKIWTEAGDEVKEPPEWFWNEARKMGSEALNECGLKLPSVQTEKPDISARPVRGRPTKHTKSLPIAKEPNQIRLQKQWTCELCGEQMSLRVKGVHIGRHRMKEKSNGGTD